jgi:hypothetical protein
MNHFSYDVIRKDKIRDLQGEGLRSQAFHRSGARSRSVMGGASRLVPGLLGILGLLSLLIR